MKRTQIKILVQCSNQTITRALNPKTKPTKTIEFIRFLLKLEDEYLNKTFTDTRHTAMCRVVVKKAKQSESEIVKHAADCIAFTEFLNKKKELPETVLLPGTTNIVTAFEYNDNYAERLFLDPLYGSGYQNQSKTSLCDLAIKYSKEEEIRMFASSMMLEHQYIRARLYVKFPEKIKKSEVS